jgi:hypothetical protein
MLLGGGAGGGDGDGGTPLFCAISSPNTDRFWLDRNLGARQVATTMGDSNAYGDYFRFSSNNDICPKGFSVPTRKELAAETTLYNER